MFLSKITLQNSPETAKELIRLDANGAYASHQLLWQLFSSNSERNFLFREEIGCSGSAEFYVLSTTEPENVSPLFNVHTKQFAPKLFSGQRLAYKLRVNPTVCIRDENGKSKRHDVLMHKKFQSRVHTTHDAPLVKTMMNQAACDWILDVKRLRGWGIQLDAVPEVERYSQHRCKKKSGNAIQFSSVDFQGVLTVTDVACFFEQYCKGFGRAKALGCGLMLIRPL